MAAGSTGKIAKIVTGFASVVSLTYRCSISIVETIVTTLASIFVPVFDIKNA